MFSFSSSIFPKELENKEGSIEQSTPSRQKIQRYYSDFLTENNNEIETPQFKDFLSHQAKESLFDSYHYQFSQKNNQLINLISTCQKLGLDVEYLEDSDEQEYPDTPKELKLSPKLLSIPEKHSSQQLDQTITPISYTNYLYKFKGIQEKCRTLKIAVNDTTQFTKDCLEKTKEICLNYASLFTGISQRFQSNILELKAENLRLNNELNTSSIENTVLEGKIKTHQATIQTLTRQKDEGDQENRKLHLQLQKLHKKLSQMMTRKFQSQQLRKQLDKSQQRNSQYQNYLSELQQKVDIQEYKLKQSKREYQILYHEHKGIRRQLQGQYRQLFERSVKEMTHKIEVQTYYRFKEDQQQRNSYQPNPKSYKSTLMTPHRQNTKSSLSGSFSSTRLIGQRNSKDLIRSFNLQSSSGNQLEAQQRKVQNILEDIKRMGPATRFNRYDSRKGF